MTRGRLWGFGVLAVCAVAVCVRLGVWQLARLDWRRGQNALVAGRGAAPPLPLDSLRRADTAVTHWRRVLVAGVVDHAAELVLASRSQAGMPGVQLLTPVRPLGDGWGDTAVLVLRGFVGAADGRTIDFVRAREGDTLRLAALVTTFPPPRPGGVRLPSAPRAVRQLHRDSLEALLGRPLVPAVLLALGDTAVRDVTRPARVPPPAPGDGPHLSYALQWFSFALVFLLGFAGVAWRARGGATRPPQAPAP
ncbi:MAG: SURF1 family protein [Gemmatimonadetes bacterium]|nr:SURF1 family protein [Gemmatimonadota bacterium]